MAELNLHTDSTLSIDIINVGGLDSGTTTKSFSTSGIASVNASNTISIDMKGGLIQHKTFTASTGLSECNALMAELMSGHGIFSLTLTESYTYYPSGSSMPFTTTNRYSCNVQFTTAGHVRYMALTEGGNILVLDDLASRNERVDGIGIVTKNYSLLLAYIMFNN